MDNPLLPWAVASRWGNPDYDEAEPFLPTDLLGWLSLARSMLGLAVIVIVVVGSTTQTPVDVLNDEGWGKAVTTIAVALGVVPVLMVVVRLINVGNDLRWWPVVWRVLVMFASTFVPMAPIIWGALNMHRTEELIEWARQQGGWAILIGLGLLVLALLAVVYAVWVWIYVLTVAMWALRTSLWSGVFHPLLAPVTGIVVVVITTVAQLVEADTKGLSHGTWLWLTVGGLVTSIAVAAAEYAMLRRDGETWRGQHRAAWPG